jgi:DNA-binding XRE family transcriptional regulator
VVVARGEVRLDPAITDYSLATGQPSTSYPSSMLSNRRILKTRVALGRALRQARQRSGLSQERLALLAEIHPTYVGMLERGVKSPTVDTLDRICAVLGLKISALLGRAEKLAALTRRQGGT